MAAETPKSSKTSQMIVETFKKFDANGDGKISKDELKRVLNAISASSGNCSNQQAAFDDDAVNALLQASDTNKDGFIDYQEFVSWVTQDMKEEEAQQGGSFKPLDKRGKFQLEFRSLLPERFEVNVNDRYDMDKLQIGEGGFGKVFIARDKQFSDRKVAVKRMKKNPRSAGKGAGNADLSNFDEEIKTMKTLDHPNICKLLATFEDKNDIYFVMELCEGGEVFDRIIENGFISERTTSIIVQQVCAALGYAHGFKIAHRDIKPENVVFCTKERSDLRVKVIDWGLACNFLDGQMKKAVGSLTYAAPEVIDSKDRKAYTEACDLWSVGVLTYVMLCGKPPFWGDRNQHFKAAKAERYPFRDEPWDKMNQHAKDFVKNLLKADPTQRTPIASCLTSPWLATPPAEAASDESKASVLGNLKNFTAQSTFSRLCITAVARQLDHKHLGDIHKVFREMDTDGNGVLSMEEVRKGISAFGDPEAEKNIQALFANLDMDGSKTIDYTEFCAAGLGEKTCQQDDVIWAAFKTFDIDNSGYITVDNLKEILDAGDVQDIWTEGVCRQVADEIVTKFDKDGDNRINFDDWQKLMQGCWNKNNPSEMHASDLLAKVAALDLGS